MKNERDIEDIYKKHLAVNGAGMWRGQRLKII